MGGRPLSNFSRPGAPAQLKQTVPYRPDRPMEDPTLSSSILGAVQRRAGNDVSTSGRLYLSTCKFSSNCRAKCGPCPRFHRGVTPSPVIKTLAVEAGEGLPWAQCWKTLKTLSRNFDLEVQAEVHRGQILPWRNAPPVPRPVHQYRQDVLHTPSESSSSTFSSFRSNNSSIRGSSPGDSPASSLDIMSPLSSVASHHGEDDRMRVAGLSYQNKHKPNVRPEEPGLRAEQPSSKSPPRDFARPAALKGPIQQIEPSSAPPAYGHPMESPMDPALQNQQLMEPNYDGTDVRPPLQRTATAPLPERQMLPSLPESQEIEAGYRSNSPPSNRQANTTGRSRSRSNAGALHRNNTDNSAMLPPPPPIPQDLPRPQPLARRPSTKKPPCRGCGIQIEGKSVKAADGRLTGRWHKACFTCKTCDQPFTTADFYVIDNQPYCEQHYHEKNGSAVSRLPPRHRGSVPGDYQLDRHRHR